MRLCFEKYTNNDIECILRDLSVSENLDIKTLLEKHRLSQLEDNKSKKIRQIINNNKMTLNKNKLDKDMERLKYFKNLKNINNEILREISNFSTEYGKTKMKLKLLKIAFKKKFKKYIIDLYLQIITCDIEYSKKEKKLMSKVTKFMKSINYKELQFKELSNQLSPLDFYNTHNISLDEWQLQGITLIDKGESVLISAPTSCGKTWLSLYPGILKKKILFIVPTEALVFQVGSMFSKYVVQPTLISDNVMYVTDNNIVIGTPKAIEDKLPVLDIDFDIIIIDEIHNLGCTNEHHYYERLLKIFSDKQLLALSATIGEPYKLLNWLKKIGYDDINLVSYTTRFLNLQRQLFIDNKLIKIHPVSCLDLEDINNKFLKKNIPMTPYDCIILYESLNEKFPKEMKNLNINNIFPQNNRRLSLDDSRHYENLLKDKLIELRTVRPSDLQEILDKYKIVNNIQDEINLYNLFKEIKRKELTPCIVFQENTQYCKDIFIKLVGYLEKLESLNYPNYYSNLEYKQKQYLASLIEISKFKKGIKLGKDGFNKAADIEEKVKGKQEELNKIFYTSYSTRLKKQIEKIKKSEVTKKIADIQVKNIELELDNLISHCKLQYIDIFKKHIEFSLNNDSQMTEDKIREIRKTISKKLEIDVSYTNVFMQGLKRGIGIYTKHMPSAYNMIVQKLAQNGELGFVVADEQLALGINMPFRSSCILGYKDSKTFKGSNYIQMIGRAGRRGKDKEGHVIFVNVDWKNLMKSEINEIKSKYVHLPTYRILNSFTQKYHKNVEKVFKHKMIEDSSEYEVCSKSFDSDALNAIIWKLREYGMNVINFCDNIIEIEKTTSDIKNRKSLYHSVSIISKYFFDEDVKEKLMNVLKNNRIIDSNSIKIIISFLKIIIEVHMSLSSEPNTYNNLIIQLNYTFTIFKKILNTSNNLN